MRIKSILALVALCFVFQGNTKAVSSPLDFTIVSTEASEISKDLSERILGAVAQLVDIDLQCLCEQYWDGEIQISVDRDGYLVEFSGGGLIILIDDNF